MLYVLSLWISNSQPLQLALKIIYYLRIGIRHNSETIVDRLLMFFFFLMIALIGIIHFTTLQPCKAHTQKLCHLLTACRKLIYSDAYSKSVLQMADKMILLACSIFICNRRHLNYHSILSMMWSHPFL